MDDRKKKFLSATAAALWTLVRPDNFLLKAGALQMSAARSWVAGRKRGRGS